MNLMLVYVSQVNIKVWRYKKWKKSWYSQFSETYFECKEML